MLKGRIQERFGLTEEDAKSFLESDCMSIEEREEVLVMPGEEPHHTREFEGSVFKYRYFVRRPVWRTAKVNVD